MHRKTSVRLVSALLCLFLLGACERRAHLVEQSLLEFGTIIKITLISNDLSRAEKLLTQIETQLKTYRRQWHDWEDSDLHRFNQALAAGDTVPIPPSVDPLLRLSQQYHLQSNGLFNPALGKLVAAYGFHGGKQNPALIDKIKNSIPDMQDLIIEGNLAHSRNENLQIDLGGIAKGYAIRLIGEFLDRNGVTSYVINAGGDLLTAGNRFGKPWRIGIQNPYAPGVIGGIHLDGRYSLFTSGNYQRQYRQGVKNVHHIIDPRNGESSSGLSSATVLMQDPVKADVAATVLMIDGLRGHDFLSKSLGIENFIVINESREIISSASMADKLLLSVNWPVKIVN